MHKVLVTEIGSETTVVNAFGDLDTENPNLLGQGLSRTIEFDGDVGMGLRLAISDLEKDIGSFGYSGEIPFYVTSSLPTWQIDQEVKDYNILDAMGRQGNLEILPTSGAIMKVAQLIYEEVGDVLILRVGSASTDVYYVTQTVVQHTVEEDLGVYSNAMTLVKLIGEARIKEHHGQDWDKFLKTRPETLEEIALSAELTAAAVTIALQRFIGRSYDYNGTNSKVSSAEGRDLTQIRWVVGTGSVLTQLPNGLEIMSESIKGMGDAFAQEGIAMLLDKDCIMASLGALTTTFRQGAWQLLRESLGVEN
jgi:hypothetical protein